MSKPADSTPSTRLDALEASVKELQAGQSETAKSIEGLQSGIDTLTESMATVVTAVTSLKEEKAKADEAPKGEAKTPTPEPKAETPAPVASESTLTLDAIKAVFAEGTKDLGGKLAAMEGKLTELRQANEEASKTKTPQLEDEGGSISGSASAGGEGTGDPNKPKSYDDVFAADQEVNPEGWKSLAESPRDELGQRARMRMELKYGTRDAYNKALGLGNEAPKAFVPKVHRMSVFPKSA